MISSEGKAFSRLKVALFYLSLMFGLICPLLSATGVASERPLVVVMDGSGSMWGRLPSNELKADVQRNELTRLLRELPDSAKLGLVVYGSRERTNPKDVTVLSQVEPLSSSRSRLIERIQSIQPLGMTPLAESIRVARDLLLRGGFSAGDIVVLTDDYDTTGETPERVAEELANAYDIRVHVLAVGASKRDEELLRRLAELGKGSFRSARNASQFREALSALVLGALSASPRQRAEAQPTATPQEGGVKKIRLSVNLVRDGAIRIDGLPGVMGSIEGWTLRSVDGTRSINASGNSLDGIPPGRYTISFKVRGFPEPITFNQEIEIKPNETSYVRLDSGVNVEIAQDLVNSVLDYTVIDAESNRQLFTVRSDMWGAKFMLPGKYRMMLSVRGFDRPLFLQQTFSVVKGEMSSVKLSSGINLIPDKTAEESVSRITIRDWGSDNVVAVMASDMWGRKFLPSGTYRISFLNRDTDREVFLNEPMVVRESSVSSLSVNSFVSLSCIEELKAAVESWSLRESSSGRLIFTTSDLSGAFKFVPPGSYTIFVRNKGGSQEIPAESIQVASGERVQRALESGIHLQPEEMARNRITSWTIYAKENNLRVDSLGADLWDPKFIPPGSYRIAVMDRITGTEVNIADSVSVAPKSIVILDIK